MHIICASLCLNRGMSSMKPARIILLAVALGAGGLAALFAVKSGPKDNPVEVAAPVIERTKVLIATQTIGIGQRVSPGMLDWQAWPDDALRPEFITNTAVPDARNQLEGVVARFEIFIGEPVREAKLVQDTGLEGAQIRGICPPLLAKACSVCQLQWMQNQVLAGLSFQTIVST